MTDRLSPAACAWRFSRTLLVAVLFLTQAPACGSNDVAGPPPLAPSLELTVEPSFLGPRERARITIELTPTVGDPVVTAWIALVGGGTQDSLALPLSGDQPQGAYADLTVPHAPLRATVHITAYVGTRAGASAEAEGVLTIGDTTPPRARWVYVDDIARVGQTAAIGAAYHDRSGLSREELHLSGAIVRDEANDLQDFPSDGSIALTVVVPDMPGDSIVQRATATDMYGLQHSIRQVYHIVPAP